MCERSRERPGSTATPDPIIPTVHAVVHVPSYLTCKENLFFYLIGYFLCGVYLIIN